MMGTYFEVDYLAEGRVSIEAPNIDAEWSLFCGKYDEVQGAIQDMIEELNLLSRCIDNARIADEKKRKCPHTNASPEQIFVSWVFRCPDCHASTLPYPTADDAKAAFTAVFGKKDGI